MKAIGLIGGSLPRAGLDPAAIGDDVASTPRFCQYLVSSERLCEATAMKFLTLLAVSACGLGLAANAHASSGGLGDRLATAGDNLISAVASSLGGGGSSTTSSSDSGNTSGTTGDVPSSPRSSNGPSGDLIGTPSESTHKSSGGATSHHDGSHESSSLGWQSLLPGSIQ